MNFKLARIVKTGNIHQEIYLGNSKEIDCIPGELILVKIIFRGLKDQMLVKVDFKLDKKRPKHLPKPDYKAYMSLTVREPTESNCDRVVVNVRFFLFNIFVTLEKKIYI